MRGVYLDYDLIIEKMIFEGTERQKEAIFEIQMNNWGHGLEDELKQFINNEYRMGRLEGF